MYSSCSWTMRTEERGEYLDALTQIPATSLSDLIRGCVDRVTDRLNRTRLKETRFGEAQNPLDIHPSALWYVDLLFLCT